MLAIPRRTAIPTGNRAIRVDCRDVYRRPVIDGQHVSRLVWIGISDLQTGSSIVVRHGRRDRVANPGVVDIIDQHMQLLLKRRSSSSRSVVEIGWRIVDVGQCDRRYELRGKDGDQYCRKRASLLDQSSAFS